MALRVSDDMNEFLHTQFIAVVALFFLGHYLAIHKQSMIITPKGNLRPLGRQRSANDDHAKDHESLIIGTTR